MSDITKHSIAHVVGGLVVAILVGLFGLISTKFGQADPFNAPVGWVFWAYLVAACLLTVLLAGALNKRFNRLRPVFEPIDCDFHILKKEILYEYKNPERTQLGYSKIVTVKALKDGLECYRDKYLWTGRGDVNIKSGISAQVHRDTIKKNVWQFYEIRFKDKLNRGEQTPTILNFDLDDPLKKAVPFFSASIEEPTDLLILDLTLPTECGVQEVVCEESCSIGARKPYSETTKILKDGKVRWEIPHPKLLHHYEMKWVFPS